MASPFLVVRFDAAKAARSLGVFTNKQKQLFKNAVKSTMNLVAVEIKRRVQTDISRAGNFSSRWGDAFQAIPIAQGDKATIIVGFSSAIPFAHVHEFGATIRGKPLLWIPLSFGDAPKSGEGSGKVSARDYPGQLFRVDRAGKNPLLMSKTGAQYVGVASVTLRPRFHIRSIVSNVVKTELARMFGRFVKGPGNG